MTLEITTVVTSGQKEKTSMDRWKANPLIIFCRRKLVFNLCPILLSRRATIRREMSTRREWTSSTFPSTR